MKTSPAFSQSRRSRVDAPGKSRFSRPSGGHAAPTSSRGGAIGEQPPLGQLGPAAVLIGLLAVCQGVLYPGLSGDRVSTWLAYWVYLVLGVILPGTLVAVRFLGLSLDRLTWLGMGWVLGHALELSSLLVARHLGVPRLFVAWIPIGYLVALLGRSRWKGRRAEERSVVRGVLAAAVVMMAAALPYFGLNRSELSATPVLENDSWFHINNGHEFRDHADMQNPRLAGEPLNYHVFSYAPAAAASLTTGDPVATHMVRYAGLSAVWLAVLLVFNTGRLFATGRVLPAFCGTVLFALPFDLPHLLSERLDAGAAIWAFGLYLSNSTVWGYIYLLGVALPLVEQHLTSRRGETWVIALLAFAGAGSKAMLGPLLVSASAGMVVWSLVFRWRVPSQGQAVESSWSVSATLFGVVSLAVFASSANLILGKDSFSSAFSWVFGAYGAMTPFYGTLHAWLPWAGILIKALWVPAFFPLILFGAAFATAAAGDDTRRARYCAFAWTLYAASLVPTMALSMKGYSQLFFVYYGLVVLAPVAGLGLVLLARAAASSLRLAALAAFGVAVVACGAQWLAPGPHGSPFGPAAVTAWPGVNLRPLAQPEDLRGLATRTFVLTPEIREGLAWAREHLGSSDVFVANRLRCGVYSAYCERRSFFETLDYTPEAHLDMDLARQRYGWRSELVEDWVAGRPGALDRLEDSGVTVLFVDHLNGPSVSLLPEPVFRNRDFSIHRLP